jgi:hypothetical protein
LKEIDLKQRMREIKFTTEHVLTKDQRNELIRAKLERAERMHRFDKVQQERVSQP